MLNSPAPFIHLRRIFEMYESRCGVRCNVCENKEKVHCSGCLEMEKPFWGGDCAVKSCCEGKGLHHCGECADFPCGVLCDMGKDQGFDPAPKIAQCKIWASESGLPV